MYLSGQYSSYCMCRRLGDITDKGIFSEKMFVSWLIVVGHLLQVRLKLTFRLGYSPRSSTLLAVKRVESEGRGLFTAKTVELRGF